MSDNVKVLVVGAGLMAKEYCKVLQALRREPVVVGRSESRAVQFEEEMGISVLPGGIEKNITEMDEIPEYAIVAVDVRQLAAVTQTLLSNGIKNILLEKPGALTRSELEANRDMAAGQHANVYIAYNRRYYASTQKALEIIEEDGGVSSFHFEFTEWSHVIEKAAHPQEVKEKWILCNSTHVLDLAFFLGGFPEELAAYAAGSLKWHSSGSVYVGGGITEKGALFSYHANWAAPGRWAVEVLTNKHRLYLKPMETLQVQELAAVAVNPIEIDDRLDKEFKPGLYRQVESFLENIDDGKKITIAEQAEHLQFYEKIAGCSY